MRHYLFLKEKKAQTAVEYMLLLAAVVAIVLIGFRRYMPRFYNASNIYFNQVGIGILGMENRCGDGNCADGGGVYGAIIYENCEKCPVDCGYCTREPEPPGPYG